MKESLYGLEISSKKMLDLNFSQVIPYSNDSLMFFYSPVIAVVMKNIGDGRGSSLSIKTLMDANPKVFGTKSIPDRVKEFYADMDLRLDRYFEKKKDDTLFFDKFEQAEFKDVMSGNVLYGDVVVFTRERMGDALFQIEPMSIPETLMKDLYDPLFAEVGVVLKTSPYVFYDLLKGSKNAEPYNDLIDRSEIATRRAFQKYPELLEVRDKNEFKTASNLITKRNHPDIVGLNMTQRELEIQRNIFLKVTSDLKDVQLSYWYMTLPGNEDEVVRAKKRADENGGPKFITGKVIEKEVKFENE